ATDCGACVRVDPVYLHRVCADVLSDGSRKVSFRAAGGSGVLCHAGVLPAVADPDPDHGDVHHARPRAPRRGDEEPIREISTEIRAVVRKIPRRLSATARNHARTPEIIFHLLRDFLLLVAGAGVFSGTRFFSPGGRGPDSSALS